MRGMFQGKKRTGCSDSRSKWHVLVVLAAALAAPLPSQAQNFPSRQVRIVVPFQPGAASDAVARLIANGLSSQWSQQVVVDNRPGGNTVIGMEMVARSEPDGHTLVFTSDDSFTILPHLMRGKMSVDPIKDLTPVNLSAKVAMIIVAHSSVPENTLPDLIARARAKPGSISYGSYGTGGSAHLFMEQFKSLAKVDLLHVPYKGVAPALAAVTAGEVNLAMSGYGTARGMIESGRIKPLAIASPDRVRELPGIPTMVELGYGEADGTVWWGLAAPAKTPADTVNRIHESVSKVLNSPETKKVIEGRSLSVSDLGPKAFAELIARESKVRAEIIRRANVKAD
jgi:tripartite-type tricarboxylate transporter receptor subunit TctC